MKKILFFLLCTGSVFSQNSGKIAQKILDFQKNEILFEQKSIFSELSNFDDFEDGLQYFVALQFGCDSIITRNKKKK